MCIHKTIFSCKFVSNIRPDFVRSFLTALLVCYCLQGFAGGFQISMQGNKAASMAGAFSSVSKDASSVYFNPGAIHTMDKNMIVAGGNVRFFSTSFLSNVNGNSDAKDAMHPSFHLYGSFKLSKKLSAGIGLNNPFRVDFEWEDDWEGKYLVREFKINAWNIQPTLCYAFSEKAGIGAGAKIMQGTVKNRRAIPVNNAEAELDGSGFGFGFNAGFFAKMGKYFSSGVTYRSAVKCNVSSGDAVFTGVPSSLQEAYPSGKAFESEIEVPAVLSASISTEIKKKFMAVIEYNYFGWKNYDLPSYTFEDSTLTASFAPEKGTYRNTSAFRFGLWLAVSRKIDVRAGIALHQSPLEEKNLHPNFPDSDKTVYSIGAGLKISEKMSLDFSALAEKYIEVKSENTEQNFGGTYKLSGMVAGLSLNYSF
jgi:long-chain fatty acid transport protein